MTAPLCIDLFCGLGGWTEGFLAEGYDVIGFDVERHVYGEHCYPSQLVLQDVCTIDGGQFRDATIIVASSPCQEFSYRAMPWKRAKLLPPPQLGMHLFAQAARIQREASSAAGRYIPMIQENVRGAQKWVGRARRRYGSYYLWGDVPGPSLYFAINLRHHADAKVPGQDWTRFSATGEVSRFNMTAIKNTGGSWFNVAHNKDSGTNNNPARGESIGEGIKVGDRNAHRASGGALKSARFTNADEQPTHADGIKQGGDWFNNEVKRTDLRWQSSKSDARRAASARIAKIPFSLARYVAHHFAQPEISERAS